MNTTQNTRHRLPSGCPPWSPWGEVQDARHVGQGVYFVSTASHGGLYVPKGMLDAMPAVLRCNRYSGGGQWFEEDVEWALPVVWRPELFGFEHVDAARRTLLSYRGRASIYAAAAEWVAENRPAAS